ncbi:MAG: cell division protein ZapE [Pseudomonadota bacterium]
MRASFSSARLPMPMTTPLTRYEDLIAEGVLAPDAQQRACIARLTELAISLTRWEKRQPTGLRRFNPISRTAPTPTGFYIWGGVGRGKTLLMDLFFNNTAFTDKQRVHFHEFMQQVHGEIARWRGLTEAERLREPTYHRDDGDDPIAPVARAIIKRGRLICFDEFHVNDITDAMILGRLFDDLFREKAVVVATSNRHPTDLYKDGLNRGLFEPFIDRLTAHMETFNLAAAKDYRLDRLPGQQVYFYPLSSETTARMDRIWAGIIAGAEEASETIDVGNRPLKIARAARGCARFTFDELCAQPLGPADYLAIAQRYGTILIDDVAVMTAEHRNEAKRFVTLVDALYEREVKVVISADGPADSLYVAGSEAFEFDRTVSRLLEMQSKEYLSRERQ